MTWTTTACRVNTSIRRTILGTTGWSAYTDCVLFRQITAALLITLLMFRDMARDGTRPNQSVEEMLNKWGALGECAGGRIFLALDLHAVIVAVIIFRLGRFFLFLKLFGLIHFPNSLHAVGYDHSCFTVWFRYVIVSLTNINIDTTAGHIRLRATRYSTLKFHRVTARNSLHTTFSPYGQKTSRERSNKIEICHTVSFSSRRTGGNRSAMAVDRTVRLLR